MVSTEVLIPSTVLVLLIASSDVTLYAIGGLVASGKISAVFTIIVFCAILLYDGIVFGTVTLVKRYQPPFAIKVFSRINTFAVIQKAQTSIEQFEKRRKTNPVLSLLLLKLLPLSRISIVFYLAQYKRTFKIFLLHNFIVLCVWVLILFIPGYLVGRYAPPSLTNINMLITIFSYGIVFILVVYIGKNKLIKFLLRRTD